MKRVLIISYYWPPSGGAGVQRWLKFAKYLPEFGWDPVVVTPENPSFINQDPSLLSEAENIEVIRLPIWEPYHLLDRLKGKPTHQKEVRLTGNQSLSQKMMVWIRGNLFVPDPRKYWVRPTLKFLMSFLEDSDINTVITTGPPHSLHLIGLKLKKRKPEMRWIADFRDPWSKWDVLDTLKLSSFAWRKHKHLERKVLEHCDALVSVGWEMDKDLKRLGAQNTRVITNGFDPEDFKGKITYSREPDQPFTIRHIGSIDDQRDPRPFIELVSRVRSKMGRDIEIEFIGNVNPSLSEDVSSNEDWASFVGFRSYVPHHEVIRLFGQTDLLLLVLAHSHSSKLNITGKIFEYMASGCPVLGIGDTSGDAARVLENSEAGRVFERTDHEGMEQYLEWIMEHGERPEFDHDKSAYSRKNLAGQLAKLLDEL